MRPYGLASGEAFAHFIKGWAVERVAQLAEQVIGEGHAFQRRTRLEFAMQVGRYIPDLNHDRHVISNLACVAHVKGLKGAVSKSRMESVPM
jgi:hypothetical protein